MRYDGAQRNRWGFNERESERKRLLINEFNGVNLGCLNESQ